MKYILHKPSASIFPYIQEPTVREDTGANIILLKGMGCFNLDVCEILSPKTKIERILFRLLWLYQSNIRNKKLYYSIKNKFI